MELAFTPGTEDRYFSLLPILTHDFPQRDHRCRPAWGAVNIFLEKPYARQFIGAGAAIGLWKHCIAALQLGKRSAVDVDTDVDQ